MPPVVTTRSWSAAVLAERRLDVASPVRHDAPSGHVEARVPEQHVGGVAGPVLGARVPCATLSETVTTAARVRAMRSLAPGNGSPFHGPRRSPS